MANLVVLTGNVGQDPDTRFLPDQRQVSNFSVATNEYWTGRDGNKQQRTEWHRVVAFGRLAEVVAKYLSKGRLVHIEGSLRTRKWKDRDGKDRQTTEIVAGRVEFLGGNPSVQKPRSEESDTSSPTNGSEGMSYDNTSGDEPPPMSDADVPY